MNSVTRQDFHFTYAGLMLSIGIIGLAWAGLAFGIHSHLHTVGALPDSFEHPVSSLSLFGLTLGGWVVMVVAMMLPSSLPLVWMFHRMVSHRASPRTLVLLLLAGYVAVWTVVGMILFSGQWTLQSLLFVNEWATSHRTVLAGGLLIAAGLYQFSSLKYRCLDQCRSPLAFIVSHWQAKRPRWEAWQLGVSHGWFCVGCCWSLMVVLVVLGLSSMWWMLAGGTLMAMEKNMKQGRALAGVLGVVLIFSGILAVIQIFPPLSF